MGFWVYITSMNMVIPLIMIFFGKYFIAKAPNKINRFFGYRTSMSMKNEDTWKFAHKYCGRIWYMSGLVMAPIVILVMAFAVGKSKDFVEALGGILCAAETIYIVGSIIPVEIALRKNFDKNGKRLYK